MAALPVCLDSCTVQTKIHFEPTTTPHRSCRNKKKKCRCEGFPRISAFNTPTPEMLVCMYWMYKVLGAWMTIIEQRWCTLMCEIKAWDVSASPEDVRKWLVHARSCCQTTRYVLQWSWVALFLIWFNLFSMFNGFSLTWLTQQMCCRIFSHFSIGCHLSLVMLLHISQVKISVLFIYFWWGWG